MDLLSHPHKPYYMHVREIIEIGKELIEIFGPEDEKKKEEYMEMLRLIAFFHDLGKLTEENQKRIKNSEKLAHEHSKYGEFIFTIFWIKTQNENEKNIIKSEIVKFIIRHHHSPFRNFVDKNENLTQINNKDKNRIEEIFSKIDKVISNLKGVFQEEKISYLYQCKNINIDEMVKIVQTYEETKPSRLISEISGDLQSFIDTLFLASIFFIADRMSASARDSIEIEEEIKKLKEKFSQKTFKILTEKFDKFVKEKLLVHDEIDKKRKEYYEKSIHTFLTIFNNDINTRVYKIFLPTGIGKTYIGTKIALEISRRYCIPIVYSLPFINITDQIYEILSRIFDDENYEGEKTVKKLHYLSIIEENDEFSPFEDIINFETSPILVTTFVQIFHSLFGVEKDFLLRFPFLVNSCIIIDEVQALDPKFYYVFEELVKTLSNMGFRIRIVIISATLPPLFSQNDSNNFAIEITKDFREESFKIFDRYRIKIVSDEKNLEEYKIELKRKILGEYAEKKCIGIICNKVEEARQIFEFLKNIFGEGDILIDKEIVEEYENRFFQLVKRVSLDLQEDIKKLGEKIFNLLKGEDENEGCIGGYIGYYSRRHKTLLIYLAANLINISKMNRSRFLSKVMELLKRQEFKFPITLEGKEIDRLIVVSTQVIEAGVDFDFEVVFRSFAPFESLIQTAGRVNRNNKWKHCGIMEVYKVRMDDRETFSPIYPRFLIDKTNEIIKNRKEISEKDILPLMEEYLKKLEHMRKKELIKDLKLLSFEKIHKNFKIIEEIIGSFNLFLDSKSGEIYDNLKKVKERIRNVDYKTRRSIYKKLLPYVYFLKARVYLLKGGLPTEFLQLVREGKIRFFIALKILEGKKSKEKEDLLKSLYHYPLFIAEKDVYNPLTGFNFTQDYIAYVYE